MCTCHSSLRVFAAQHHIRVCVCVCVCARARAYVLQYRDRRRTLLSVLLSISLALSRYTTTRALKQTNLLDVRDPLALVPILVGKDIGPPPVHFAVHPFACWASQDVHACMHAHKTYTWGLNTCISIDLSIYVFAHARMHTYDVHTHTHTNPRPGHLHYTHSHLHRGRRRRRDICQIRASCRHSTGLHTAQRPVSGGHVHEAMQHSHRPVAVHACMHTEGGVHRDLALCRHVNHRALAVAAVILPLACV